VSILEFSQTFKNPLNILKIEYKHVPTDKSFALSIDINFNRRAKLLNKLGNTRALFIIIYINKINK
jgi:hypothetical protein